MPFRMKIAGKPLGKIKGEDADTPNKGGWNEGSEIFPIGPGNAESMGKSQMHSTLFQLGRDISLSGVWVRWGIIVVEARTSMASLQLGNTQIIHHSLFHSEDSAYLLNR
jgi:hypothetical protein